MEGAKLVVRRTLDEDIKMRDLYVILDDERERTVLYPRTLELPLAPGEHRLKITNRLFTREESFRVEEGETVVYAVANTVKGGIFGIIVAGLTAAYSVTMRRL